MLAENGRIDLNKQRPISATRMKRKSQVHAFEKIDVNVDQQAREQFPMTQPRLREPVPWTQGKHFLESKMKLVLASVVALSVISAPALAQTTPSAMSTKTTTTSHHKATATKTTASEEKGETAAQEAKERQHARHHHKKHHGGATATKTMVTKGPKSTAVTTVTTKVKPNTPSKG